MKWPRFRRREASAEKDAHYAEDVEHMNRALTDAKHLHRAAADLNRRADDINDQWREARARNGIAEAAIESIRRRAQHP